MIYLHLIVEGHSEENFVKRILAPYLGYDYCVEASRVTMSKDKSRGQQHKGGLFKYEKAKTDITNWLKQDRRRESRFTTMFDFYHLPNSFPDFSDAETIINDPYKKVKFLEESLAKDISDSRFIPYIQLHEFEAMIFVDPSRLIDEYPDAEKRIEVLKGVTTTPELINDDPNTAPSKRILAQIPNFNKPFAGVNTVEKIGIDAIRKKCPHFDEWLKKLERLQQQYQASYQTNTP